MPLSYPYKPRIGLMVLATLFFAVCAAVLGSKAATADHGVVLNGLVELSAGGARTFYWVLAGLSAAFVAAGLFSIAVGLFSQRSLQVSDSELSAPSYLWASAPIVVSISDISEIRLRTISGQRMLLVRHRGGALNIMEKMLPDRASFEAVHAAIAERAGQAGKLGGR
ncbi:hypothetical protein [Inquilinus sp. Marseille-Q2685]|uniref:hypothetical protein n=1 Tax=Inquilinus sp. Marseille-Q2685 TaxID=2866581 RepID=UPI001CE46EAF|nr:hypothetical protein [Inquilinus sp. Marseille-Q2685]